MPNGKIMVPLHVKGKNRLTYIYEKKCLRQPGNPVQEHMLCLISYFSYGTEPTIHEQIKD